MRNRVPSAPLLMWLQTARDSTWEYILSESQMRYVLRVLQRRPATVDFFCVDDLLVALDQPHLLTIWYPEDS